MAETYHSLKDTDSPKLQTVKLLGLTGGKIPYHVDDETGLADGPVKTDVDDAVSKKHTAGSDTALGSVGTKNPPVDADKVLQRNSASGDALVTSTWTQVKAFLKTYFDTLYNKYVHPNHTGDVTSVADGATTIGADKVNDTHIDWGTGVNQVSAADMPIADGGDIIAATDVEAALQENRTAINLNTAKETNATHTGDVTGSEVLTIADSVVTLAKMANMASAALLGRSTAEVGAPEVLDVATVKTMLGLGTLAYLSTDLAIEHGGTGQSSAAAAFSALKQIATASATGVVELATEAETSAGSDAARAVTPDGLAGSVYGTKNVILKCIADDMALAVADGVARFTIPIELNGMNLVSVGAHVYTVSSSGLPTFEIYNLTDTSQMLSTLLTIDVNEKDSKDATTPAVIDTSHDDVATGDELQFNCTIAGTGTKGMEIRMGFRLP